MAASRVSVRQVQRLLNTYFGKRPLGFKPLLVDGKRGEVTRRRIRFARYYLGFGNWKRSDITPELLKMLANPKRRPKGWTRRRNLRRHATARRRQAARRRELKRRRQQRQKRIKGTSPGAPHWGGARYVVEEAHRAAGKPYTSSTKRGRTHYLSRKNPGSDHNEANRRAYAHDWPAHGATGDTYANRVGRHFGVARPSGSYQRFYVRRDGRLYACQLLWRVQGHYDHNHFGARA